MLENADKGVTVRWNSQDYPFELLFLWYVVGLSRKNDDFNFLPIIFLKFQTFPARLSAETHPSSDF